MMDWTAIKHFTREEWQRDPERVSPDVVMLLDEQRDAHGLMVPGVRYVIHVAWDDAGHVTDSGHYTVNRELAVAVDYHMEVGGVALPLLEQWLWAERFPWNGIGLYPFWRSPGLHCDLRRIGREHAHLGRRWWRDTDGAYKSVDEELIERLIKRKKASP